MTKRVGILALLQESNTFLDARTTLERFREDVLLEGEVIRQRFADAHQEIGGFFAGLATAGLEAVPLFAARATPYGPLTPETLDELVAQMLTALEQAGPLDGLLLAPHGATVSEQVLDVDGHWLAAVRSKVGGKIPLIATLDPHANLSPKMIGATDAIIAYRSNPHLDQRERGEEAARLMARKLSGEIRPVQSAAYPPLVINIERQHTTESPCRELIAEAERIRALPGVLSVSVVLGFPYADVPELGSSAVVVADGDADLAAKYAAQLGAWMWEHRAEFLGELISPEQAIDAAMHAPGPVALLDMGDNVGGGSPGDGTVLAQLLHGRRIGPSLVCLYAPAAVAAARSAGIEGMLSLAMGGKTDARHGAPLEARVTVRATTDGRFTESQARHGGVSHFDQGLTAIVETDRGLTVMLTSRRVPPFSLGQLAHAGLDPKKFRMIVVKGVHAPVAAYREVCPTLIRVNTPGVTTADLLALEYVHRRRPLYPFEREFEWKARVDVLG